MENFLFFITVLGVASAQLTELSSIKFVAQKGMGLTNSSAQTGFLIATEKKRIKFQCLEECKNIKLCLVAVFDKSLNCMLYSKNFQIPDKQSSSNSDLYIKHFTRSSTIAPNLYNTFLNYAGTTTMVSGFVDLRIFEFVYVNNQVFIYAADGTVDEIIMIDENWNIVRRVSYPGLISMKVVNNILYISTDSALLKTDLDFNKIRELSTPYEYHQIAYDYDTATLLMASPYYSRIDFFDLDLNQNKSIFGSLPFAVVYYGGNIYVSDFRRILVYNGTSYIRNLMTFCFDDIISIYIDQYGYLSSVCYYDTMISLNNNMGSRETYIFIADTQRHLTYDLNGICFTSSPTSIYRLN